MIRGSLITNELCAPCRMMRPASGQLEWTGSQCNCWLSTVRHTVLPAHIRGSWVRTLVATTIQLGGAETLAQSSRGTTGCGLTLIRWIRQLHSAVGSVDIWVQRRHVSPFLSALSVKFSWKPPGGIGSFLLFKKNGPPKESFTLLWVHWANILNMNCIS